MSSEPVSLNRILPGYIEAPGKATVKLSADVVDIKEKGGEFSDLFSEMISSVNDLQLDSSEIQSAFLSGDPVELHQVMIKAEEAGVAMDLLLEIRNKLVDAYKEIMRMPV